MLSKFKSKRIVTSCIPLMTSVVAILFHLIETVVDDLDIMRFAESLSFNDHSEFLIIPNVLLGYLFKPFYYVLPQVNWISVLYLSLIIICFIILHTTVYDCKNYTLIASTLVFCQLIVFIYFTFTTIAFICTFTGAIYIIQNIENTKKKRIKRIVTGSLLILFGFCMRSGSTLYFLLMIILPLLMIMMLKKKHTFKVLIVILVICISANYLTVFVNNQYVSQIPEEMYYTQINEYRSNALDYGDIDYSKHEKQFKSAGISENDYELFSKWVFADKDVFSVEKFSAISGIRGKNERYILNPVNLIKSILSDLRQTMFIFILLFFGFLSFLLCKNNRLEIIVTVLMSCGAVAYLHLIQRSITRVSIVVIITGIIMLCYVMSTDSDADLKRFIKKFRLPPKVIISVLCSCIILFGFVYSFDYLNEKRTSRGNLETIISYLEEDSKITYVSDLNLRDYVELKSFSNNIFTTNWYKTNSTLLGGWDTYSFYWYANMERLGYAECTKNAIKDVILDEHTQFITFFDPELFVNYYKEHYNLTVKYNVVKEFDDIGLYVYDFNVV